MNSYNTQTLYDAILSGNKEVQKKCFNNKVTPDRECLILYIASYDVNMVNFCKTIGLKIDEDIIKESFSKMVFTEDIERQYYCRYGQTVKHFCNQQKMQDILSTLKKDIEETNTIDSIFEIINKKLEIDLLNDRYYYNNNISSVIKKLDNSEVKLTKKIIISAIKYCIESFDISKHNIEIDDEIRDVCRKNNCYPFGMKFNDKDVVYILKSNNINAFNRLDKNYKFNSDHLRQYYVSINNMKIYKKIIKTYNPTKEDFDYCLNSLKSFNATKSKILRDIYNKIK